MLRLCGTNAIVMIGESLDGLVTLAEVPRVEFRSDVWILRLAFLVNRRGQSKRAKLGWESGDGRQGWGAAASLQPGKTSLFVAQVPAESTGPITVSLFLKVEDEATPRQLLWETRGLLSLNGKTAELTLL
jgi:hypothetical protein